MLDRLGAGSGGLKEIRGRTGGAEVGNLVRAGVVDERDGVATCTPGAGEGDEKKAGWVSSLGDS